MASHRCGFAIGFLVGNHMPRAIPLSPSTVPETENSARDWQALVDYARRWLDAEPGSVVAGNLLGFAQLRLGLNAEARTTLEGVAARHPQDESTQIYLGWAYLAEADAGQAERVARRLLERSPANPEAWVVLAYAQLLQNRLRMLSQTGHGIHPGRVGIDAARRQQGGNRPDGRRHLGPAPARLQLRMPPHVVHIVDAGVGDLRLFQPLHHLRGRQRGKGLVDHGAQRVLVRHPARIGRKALVHGQFRLPQHSLAELDPLPLVLQP